MQLKYLGFSNNDLSDASDMFVSLFKANQTLSAIDFGGCNLGDHCVSTLIRALKGNHALTYLNLRNNGFTMLSANLLCALL